MRPDSSRVSPARQVATSWRVSLSRSTRRAGAVSPSPRSGQSERSGGTKVAGTGAVERERGVAVRGALRDQPDGLGRRMAGHGSHLHVHDRRKAAEPLGSDAERVDAIVDLDAQLFELR